MVGFASKTAKDGWSRRAARESRLSRASKNLKFWLDIVKDFAISYQKFFFINFRNWPKANRVAI